MLLELQKEILVADEVQLEEIEKKLEKIEKRLDSTKQNVI